MSVVGGAEPQPPARRYLPPEADPDLNAWPGSAVQRWAGLWLLGVLFVVSLVLQAVFEFIEQGPGWGVAFGAGVFENWQSEWAQLFVQALIIQKGAERFYRAGVASELRRFEYLTRRLASIERKLDQG